MAIEEVYLNPEDYDLELDARSVADLPFWLNLVHRELPAQVLEIGCGTGRLTLPLAREGSRLGFTVTGLEAEAPMLERARAKCRAEPAAVQEAVRLFHGDVRTMHLDGRYDLVLMPYGIAHHLLKLEDQEAALLAIRRHMQPGALLCIDVGAPQIDFLSMARSGTARRQDMDATDDDGRRLRRTVASRFSPAHQLMLHTYEYESKRSDGSLHRYPSHFAMHVYFPRELQLLCRLCGFHVEQIVGSYQGDPFTDSSELLIVLARVAAVWASPAPGE